MTSRERLLQTLDHREPDRVPFDLGSTQVTGIHVVAYRNLRQALDLPPLPLARDEETANARTRAARGAGIGSSAAETPSVGSTSLAATAGSPYLCDHIQQLAYPEEDLLVHLGVDTRGLYPLNSHNWGGIVEDHEDHWLYRDEWGIIHKRARAGSGGLYYDIVQVPLPQSNLTAQAIKSHPWPDMGARWRVAGLRDQAEHCRNAGYAVVVKDAFAGIFEFAQRLVGVENLLVLMALEPMVAGALFDKLLELKLAYWETALSELGDLVDVVTYADDYGTQVSQIISPRMFRQQLKPRVEQVFQLQARLAPQARRFFHSDGNVRPLIPDFIAIGVQILNPVHVRAQGMEPTALKRDFGRDLVFWGGGVDTQGILPHGSPEQVKEDVRRNLEALAPGGGYVFCPIHNIQADVPPQNIVAMIEAWQAYGVY